MRFVLIEGADGSSRVAARWLDLDYVSPKVGELFSAVEPHGASEVEDAEIAQCRVICLSITHAAPPNLF